MLQRLLQRRLLRLELLQQWSGLRGRQPVLRRLLRQRPMRGRGCRTRCRADLPLRWVELHVGWSVLRRLLQRLVLQPELSPDPQRLHLQLAVLQWILLERLLHAVVLLARRLSLWQLPVLQRLRVPEHRPARRRLVRHFELLPGWIRLHDAPRMLRRLLQQRHLR